MECGSSSDVGSSDVRYNVIWTDVTDGRNVPLFRDENINKKTSVFTNDVAQFRPGIYTVEVLVELASDTRINRRISFDMIYEATPLSLYIKGGNIMTGYSDRLDLEGVAKDLDESLAN